ncbi:MAG: C4-dicarboxylate ABC transporter [Rhodobacterales bacterium 34-62-10]|nr:MAG: C4-dicarboxylate ABC transporter [Rhodobacterales bacterium 34-62-10]
MLATDRLTGQLQLYQQLAVVMAGHPDLATALEAGDGAGVRRVLVATADKTGALDVQLADATGRVLASANGMVDVQLAQSAYFRRAMTGALGEAHGINPVGGQRSYTFAAPIFGADARVKGAVMVLADIGLVEAEWRGARPTVFFTDDNGLVFITNRSELLFWQRAPGQVGLSPPSGPPGEFAFERQGAHMIWMERWSPYVPTRALHLARDLPVIGMRAEALVDVEPARRLATLQAGLVTAVCLAFGALLFLATERRRTLALANARLEGRVAERTRELSGANAALRREVGERAAAEAALKKVQDDLVQAGKLSALGQMSAGISHELNQPLMAIRQYAENGVGLLERGKTDVAAQNLRRIGDLAHRMGRIIRNLRAFARQESEPMGRVDLVAVINSALELSETRLARDAVTVEWTPPAPVYVIGGEVRLGQVVLNLIGNAADAMAGLDERRITLSLRREVARVVLEVADTGPGIEEPEKIFEPFYTTKAVGAAEGMGLGLSISYGLVQSFGGAIRGRNRPEGGAVFTVELTPATPDAPHAEAAG